MAAAAGTPYKKSIIGNSSATEYPALTTPTHRLNPVNASHRAKKTEVATVPAEGK
jgi:hypothetical protein